MTIRREAGGAQRERCQEDGRVERALVDLLASMGLARVPMGEAIERLHEGFARAGLLTTTE